jgi:protein KRI1
MPKDKRKTLTESDEPVKDELTINQKFAGRYEETKRKQDLGRARELGIPLVDHYYDPNDSSSEEEDEGDLLDPDMDKKIRETIAAIQKKDPKIYKPETAFFKAGEESDSSDKPAAAAVAEKKKSTKKTTAKDVLRAQLVDAAERGIEDAFEDDDGEEMLSRRRRGFDDEDRNPKLYDEEQVQLRKQFLESVSDSKNGGKQDSDDDDFLKVKPKAQKRSSKDARDSSDDDADIVDASALKTFLKSKGNKTVEHAGEIRDPEGFLSAFMRSDVWKKDSLNERRPVEVSDSEDLEHIDKADEFEAVHNFRFVERCFVD